mmetsp:Transcript_45796/g.71761  ORF Transcript_45796/g.71761 Transcript_45796/m.71761 type:complete len:84 (-) Transcript_45796:2-253(-)
MSASFLEPKGHHQVPILHTLAVADNQPSASFTHTTVRSKLIAAPEQITPRYEAQPPENQKEQLFSNLLEPWPPLPQQHNSPGP